MFRVAPLWPWVNQLTSLPILLMCNRSWSKTSGSTHNILVRNPTSTERWNIIIYVALVLCITDFFLLYLKDNAANEIPPRTTHAHSQRGISRGENESICYIKGTIAFVNSFKFHIELHWSRGWLRNVRNPIRKGNQVPFSQDLSLHIWVWWSVLTELMLWSFQVLLNGHAKVGWNCWGHGACPH